MLVHRGQVYFDTFSLQTWQNPLLDVDAILEGWLTSTSVCIMPSADMLGVVWLYTIYQAYTKGCAPRKPKAVVLAGGKFRCPVKTQHVRLHRYTAA